MKKLDFISMVEHWQVQNDLMDEVHIMSPSNMAKTEINSYVKGVNSWLDYKAPELKSEFYEMCKQNHVRGMKI